MSWAWLLPDLASKRWSAYKEQKEVDGYVEEGWVTKVDMDTGEASIVDPNRFKRKPRRETDPNPLTAKMYKKKIRARAVDYHRGALNEKLEVSSEGSNAGGDERAIRYKTTPRWNRKMLEEQRNKFWEDAVHRRSLGGEAHVWSTLKRFLEDRVRAPEKDTEGPVIDTGVVDAKAGILAHSGNWRRAPETGAMMYYYHFTDGENRSYKVPAYVITAPFNRLGGY